MAIFVIAFAGLLAIPAVDKLSALLFTVGILLVCALAWLVLRDRKPEAFGVMRPGLEGWAAVAYTLLIIALTIVTYASGIHIITDSTGLLFYFLLPLGLMAVIRKRIKGTLGSLGITAKGLVRDVVAGIAISLLILPVIILTVSAQQRTEMITVLLDPARLAIALPVSFAFALILVALPEEFLYRGVLQSRLEALTGSPAGALMIAALVFGLYHLPFAYFLASWPTNGNIAWSLCNIVTEQALAGLLLGFIFMRTHSLTAPMIVHAFIDATVLMTQFHVSG